MRFDRIVPALANAYLFGHGIATDLPTGQMAFLKSRPDVDLPDVQLIFHAAPLTATPYFWPFRRPYADSYGCRAAVLRPESRGRLELVSTDPKRPMRIRQNFLATDNDWKTLRSGLRIAREVCRQAAMRPFMARELAPGERAVTDADLDAHIRANSITVHHPIGTCKMGSADDRMAVVDPQLRVLGTESSRRRRLGDADPCRRQHQCSHHHDRRKGCGPHPRAPTTASEFRARRRPNSRGKAAKGAARLTDAAGSPSKRKSHNPRKGFTILSRLPIN